jgi:hypothetical protein
MLAVTTLGSVVRILDTLRDDSGEIVAIFGTIDGTTHHGVWTRADIVQFLNR